MVGDKTFVHLYLPYSNQTTQKSKPPEKDGFNNNTCVKYLSAQCSFYLFLTFLTITRITTAAAVPRIAIYGNAAMRFIASSRIKSAKS